MNSRQKAQDGRPPWSRARNVLAVRLDYLGDVLMTTPALRAVRASGPGRRVTLLTSSAAAPLAPLVPVVDDVITYDAPWTKLAPRAAGAIAEFALAEALRQRAFDAAIIFTVYSQNPLPAAFLCYLAGIPLRLAYCHENPYQLLTDWVPDPEPATTLRHEVQRQLDLVAEVGCRTADERLSLQVPAGAAGRVAALLAEQGVRLDRPWLAIHPGASAPSRRYPAELFAQAARSLAGQGFQVVFTGTTAEVPLVEAIRAGMAAPSHSLAGRLDLGEMAGLLAMAPLLISNNTGPAHMAAAVGTPIVDLYALTNPQHTPWGVPSRVLFHDVPCRYCYRSVCPEGHHHCLALVEPEAVVRAALDLLAETAADRLAAAILEEAS